MVAVGEMEKSIKATTKRPNFDSLAPILQFETAYEYTPTI